MGILSALSGKIYHFNSINTPIDNELAHRIKELDDDIEKLALAISFDVAQKSILQMFNPDNGVHRKFINDLSKDNLRNIWNILIIWTILTIISNKENINKEKLIKNTTLVLGLDEHKIDLSFAFFKDKKQAQQLMVLWHIICNQIKQDLDDENNFTEFTNFFVDIFNANYNKLSN